MTRYIPAEASRIELNRIFSITEEILRQGLKAGESIVHKPIEITILPKRHEKSKGSVRNYDGFEFIQPKNEKGHYVLYMPVIVQQIIVGNGGVTGAKRCQTGTWNTAAASSGEDMPRKPVDIRPARDKLNGSAGERP